VECRYDPVDYRNGLPPPPTAAKAAENFVPVASVDLILASGSPRRASLLRGIGLSPRTIVSGVDESVRSDENAESHVRRLAAEKASSVVRRLEQVDSATLVLAADTAVVCGDRILGKPNSDRDAVEMLVSLSGRTHRVLSGVRLERPATRGFAETVADTLVRFARFDESVARRYAATGEPSDKAGAYGIQGVGALLIDSIEGSWSNVVGLPLERLPGLFCEVGLDLWRLISRAPRDE
jgi:septum formation protein